MKWYPSPEFLAQAAHVLLGALLTTLPLALGFAWWATLIGIGLDLGYMLAKEFTFDILIEGDSVKTGWRDATFNLIGVAGAAVLLLVSLLWR